MATKAKTAKKAGSFDALIATVVTAIEGIVPQVQALGQVNVAQAQAAAAREAKRDAVANEVLERELEIKKKEVAIREVEVATKEIEVAIGRRLVDLRKKNLEILERATAAKHADGKPVESYELRV
jgi:hypothetical protein